MLEKLEMGNQKIDLNTAHQAHRNFLNQLSDNKSIDAQGAPVFLNHQMQEIIAKTILTQYPDVEYTKFGMTQSTKNPFATEIVRTAMQGKANIIPEKARANVIDTNVRKFEQIRTPIHAFKAATQISFLENKRDKSVNYDSLAGQLEDIGRGMAQLEDEIYLVGNDKFGFATGMFNHPQVSKNASATDIYASVKAGEFKAVQGALFAQINRIAKESYYIIKIDTIIVPSSLYMLLQNTLVAEYQNNATNLNFLSLLETTLGVKIEHSRRLPSVAVDSDHERIVLLQKNGEVTNNILMGFYTAMPFTAGTVTNLLDSTIQFYYKSTGGFVCSDIARLHYLDTAKEA